MKRLLAGLGLLLIAGPAAAAEEAAEAKGAAGQNSRFLDLDRRAADRNWQP